MPRSTWSRRQLLRFAGVPIVGGLAGCASGSDGANTPPTSTRTSTNTPSPTARTTTTTTEEPTPTEESTTTEEASKDAPGYKDSHWHGRLFFEIDGTLVDFDQQRYYLDTIEKKHPETVYFHFHDSAHGPNEWSNEKKVITFARALNLLPGISYSQDGRGEPVITYEGTTYRTTDSGVTIDIHEGTRTIDPTTYEVQHNDNFWVRITTKSATATTSGDNTRTGKLVFDVNNRRLNFEGSNYEQAGTEQFQFRDDDNPYTWFNTGEPVTLATALNTIPSIEYSQESKKGHVIQYDAGEKFGGTYRSSTGGTEIIIRQRTADVNPEQYQLRNGDLIWVYVHTDQAPDNEH